MPDPSPRSPGQPPVADSCTAPAADPPWQHAVAIVSDQPITRGGLEQLAAALPSFTVTASVASVAELDQAGAVYDVVVLDVPLREDGLSIATISRTAAVSAPVILSSWDRPPSLPTVIRAGARGCVTRQSSQRSVSCALSVVAAGGFYVCEQLVNLLQAELSRPARANSHGLAPRELETLEWIARGLTHGQIAKRMGLSQATINTYAKRVRSKLNVSNKAELTRIAIDLGHLGNGHHDNFAA